MWSLQFSINVNVVSPFKSIKKVNKNRMSLFVCFIFLHKILTDWYYQNQQQNLPLKIMCQWDHTIPYHIRLTCPIKLRRLVVSDKEQKYIPHLVRYLVFWNGPPSYICCLPQPNNALEAQGHMVLIRVT